MATKDRFDIDEQPINEETRIIAEKELRETPQVVSEALVALKELLKEATDLYYRDDDLFLMIFLRPCKFYPASALAMMRRIAEFKKNNASLLDNLMPQDEKASLLENNVVNVLTNRDQLGRRMLVVNCGGSWDTSRVSADQLFRLFYLVHGAAMLEPETQVRGVVVIMDFDGLGMKQVKALSPSFSMRLLSFIQEAMPLRLKEVHIVKEPWLFKMVWAMFKPFIKDKLNKRMFFHGSKMATLHTHIAPTHLPKEYDGQLPAFDYTSANWYPTICKYEENIRNWNSYGYVKK